MGSEQEAKAGDTSEAEASTKKTGVGGKTKNAIDNPSDSVLVQMKNTKAQVVGTWQKVSSTFRQAGKKVSGAFSGMKDKVSSKK